MPGSNRRSVSDSSILLELSHRARSNLLAKALQALKGHMDIPGVQWLANTQERPACCLKQRDAHVKSVDGDHGTIQVAGWKQSQA